MKLKSSRYVLDDEVLSVDGFETLLISGITFGDSMSSGMKEILCYKMYATYTHIREHRST